MSIDFVSYATIISHEKLEETIAELEKNFLGKTPYEEEQEKVIVDQLCDQKFVCRSPDLYHPS